MAPRGKAMSVEALIAEKREHIARADDYAKDITRLENLKKKVDDFKVKIAAEASELGVELSALGFAKVRAARGIKEPVEPPKSAGKDQEGNSRYHFNGHTYSIDDNGKIVATSQKGRIGSGTIAALSDVYGSKVKVAKKTA